MSAIIGPHPSVIHTTFSLKPPFVILTFQHNYTTTTRLDMMCYVCNTDFLKERAWWFWCCAEWINRKLPIAFTQGLMWTLDRRYTSDLAG